MLPVEQPFKTYTGIDGKPLNNGYVYFGVAGMDPITHPVTVYWDAAGTLPVSQPARTVNGYIVNDTNAPANVFYDGAYSETVIDSKGRTVFYAPTSDDFSISKIVSNFLDKLATAIGATLIGYANGGTTVSVQEGLDVLYYGVANVRSKRFAGGAKGDGTTSDSAAILAASTSVPSGGRVFFPPGNYVLDGNETLTALQNQTWEGVGFASKITIETGDLIFKSPVGLKLDRLWFAGSNLNSVQQSVCISNFTDATVNECKFSGFGGGTFNKAGSTCLYMIATDTATSQFAAGNSSGAVVSKCVFEGNGRMTNFGVRIYTDFVTVGTSTNTGAIVSDCTFNEFNWNALELAGPGTNGVVVDNCVANRCGLCPFDIDKGAHGNKMTNLTINRLLGNIDAGPTGANPNTRAAGVAISGSLDTGPYAYNNVVDGVIINLLATDVTAYQGRGVTAVNLAYVRNSSVSNVRLYCESVPTRPATAAFSLAAVCFETCSGVVVEEIDTVNATVGIVETGTFNSGVGQDVVQIKGVRNTGVLKGEVLSVINSTYSSNRYSFDDLHFSTDMSDPINAAKNACVVLINPNVGSGSLGAYSLSAVKIYCSNATSYGVYPGANIMGMENVKIGLTDQTRFFAAGGSVASLFVSDLGCSTFNSDALDVSQGFLNLPATCSVFQGSADGDFPLKVGRGNGRLYTSAIPTNPPNNKWGQPCTLDYLAPVAGSFVALVQTSAGWKQAGAVSA